MNEGDPKTRFERFSESSRRVLTLAQEEAIRFRHNYIGSEHLLLGLIREGSAHRTLEKLGTEEPRVRSQVEFIIAQGTREVTGEVGLMPQAKKIIELAVDEARKRGSNEITPDHLLVGMVREGEGIAAGVLESFGVNLEKARQAIPRTKKQKERPERIMVVEQLEQTLSNPNIDQSIKDRIQSIVSILVEIAQEQKSPPQV